MTASVDALPPTDAKRPASSSLALRRDVQSLSIQTPELPVAGVTSRRPSRRTRRRIKRMDAEEKIYDFFSWKDVIQEDGDGGKVVVCRKKSEETSDHKYILKIRNKASIGSEKDLQEFRGMLVKMLNIQPHHGVIPYLDVLEDDNYFYVVMEKAAGGSLLSYLVTKHADGCVPELEMKQLMQEILQAVDHVHKQGMIHRDIKPNNIVVRKVDDPSDPINGKIDCVTLIDFDHADTNYTPFTPTVWSANIWGTAGYNAPETYLGSFSPASDLFSVGVTLYMLMTGKMPYEVRRPRRSTGDISQDWCTQVYHEMLNAEVDWNCDPWPNELCRSFCRSLLAPRAHNRPKSVEEALQHKWFANLPGPSLHASQVALSSEKAPAKQPAAQKPTQSKERQGRKSTKDLIAAMRAATLDPETSEEQCQRQGSNRSEQAVLPAVQDSPASQQSSNVRSKHFSPDLAEPQALVENFQAMPGPPEAQPQLPLLPVSRSGTDAESEEVDGIAMPAVQPEEVETELEDQDAYAAQHAEQNMAMMQNRNLTGKISCSRHAGHWHALRSQSCDHSRSHSECSRAEQALHLIRRKRDLARMEGITSQLSPLAPHTPQPCAQAPFGVMPSTPRDARRNLSCRPGRRLRFGNSNSPWIRTITR